MNSNCEIINYITYEDFNKDTFKGLNEFSENIQNAKDYEVIKNLSVDNGYVISNKHIYYIIHIDYIEIDKIEGIINIKLNNFPKNMNEDSIEYTNYFHNITDFVFKQLQIKKENGTYIIRDVNTNQIIITDGEYNKIFYKKMYNILLKDYVYNQFSITYRT